MSRKSEPRIMIKAAVSALSIALLLLPANQVSATKLSTDEVKYQSKTGFDPADLAEGINAGLVSEEQFLKLDLSEEQILEVFKSISDKRGWKRDDGLLAKVAREIKLNTNASTKAVTAPPSCDENIEMKEGWSNMIYPCRYTKPVQGESCGSGKYDKLLPDRVLEYQLPNKPGNPTDVRWWSNQWMVRKTLQTAYGGVLGSNGFCGNTVRVCIGTKAFGTLSPGDLMTVYLWWPR